MKNKTPRNKLSQRLAIFVVVLSLAGSPVVAIGCESELEQSGSEGDNALVGDEIANRNREMYRSGDNALHARRGDRLRGLHPRAMRGRHAPEMMLIAAALTRLDLTDEQKTSVEELLEDVSPHRTRDRLRLSERAEVRDAIAEGARAGNLDPDAFREHFSELDKEIEQRRERRARALEELHRILEPAQRQQLVEAVRSRRYEPARPRDHRRGFGKRSRAGWGYRQLTRGLDLSDQQLSRIEPLGRAARAERPGPGEAISRRQKSLDAVEAMLDSFASDDLDATILEQPRRIEKSPSDRLRARIAYLAELSGILDPEQRELLAERLERGGFDCMHPAGRGKRGGHGQGRQNRPSPRARR